jgi:hypothetical protein
MIQELRDLDEEKIDVLNKLQTQKVTSSKNIQ